MAESGDDKHSGRLAAPTLSAIDALDRMWSEIDRIKAQVIGDPLMERPPRSMTAREYMDRYRLSESATKRHLRKMTQSGKLKKLHALVPNASAAVVVTAVYVPAED